MRQLIIAVLAALFVVGCQSPLNSTMDEQLREQLLATQRAYRKAMEDGPIVQVRRGPSEVEKKLADDKRIDELDQMSGLSSLRNKPLELGEDLLGRDKSDVVTISLETAIDQAVRNNIDLKTARYLPAIAQTRVTQANAVFDAEFFLNLDWAKIDDPLGVLSTPNVTTTTTLETGVRKGFTTGGSAQISTGATRTTQSSPFVPLLSGVELRLPPNCAGGSSNTPAQIIGLGGGIAVLGVGVSDSSITSTESVVQGDGG